MAGARQATTQSPAQRRVYPASFQLPDSSLRLSGRDLQRRFDGWRERALKAERDADRP